MKYDQTEPSKAHQDDIASHKSPNQAKINKLRKLFLIRNAFRRKNKDRTSLEGRRQVENI